MEDNERRGVEDVESRSLSLGSFSGNDVQQEPTLTGFPASIITTSISTTLGNNQQRKTELFSVLSARSFTGCERRVVVVWDYYCPTQHFTIVSSDNNLVTIIFINYTFITPRSLPSSINHAFHNYFRRCPAWQLCAGTSRYRLEG